MVLTASLLVPGKSPPKSTMLPDGKQPMVSSLLRNVAPLLTTLSIA
jgi:hypothetical protein